MQPKTPKLLEDIRAATENIRQFVSGRTLPEYRSDPMLRAAVERKFEIIGEAVNRIAKQDPEVAAKIDEHPRIIAFRNLLIHGYELVDDAEVWGVIQEHVPRLEQQVTELLADA